jgi:hypothetical protein
MPPFFQRGDTVYCLLLKLPHIFLSTFPHDFPQNANRKMQKTDNPVFTKVEAVLYEYSISNSG